MSHQIGMFKAEQKRIKPPSTGEFAVLSLTQPWASAIFLGLKAIETRSWQTNYRGRLYIHASNGMPKYAKEFAADERFMCRLPEIGKLPLGAIIGHVDLIDIKRTEDLKPGPIEELYGDYGPGRYGWITDNPVLLETPIPAKGSLGIWRYQVPTHKTGYAVATLCPCTCGYGMEKA